MIATAQRGGDGDGDGDGDSTVADPSRRGRRDRNVLQRLWNFASARLGARER